MSRLFELVHWTESFEWTDSLKWIERPCASVLCSERTHTHTQGVNVESCRANELGPDTIYPLGQQLLCSPPSLPHDAIYSINPTSSPERRKNKSWKTWNQQCVLCSQTFNLRTATLLLEKSLYHFYFFLLTRLVLLDSGTYFLFGIISGLKALVKLHRVLLGIKFRCYCFARATRKNTQTRGRGSFCYHRDFCEWISQWIED